MENGLIFSKRNTLSLLGGDGYDAIAPDWIGHGSSDKPADFDCSEESYKAGLGDFISAMGINKPIALIVHVR